MSESAEANNGEKNKPPNGEQSIGWLEHLASKPDAIWTAPSQEPGQEEQAESGSGEPPIDEESQQAEVAEISADEIEQDSIAADVESMPAEDDLMWVEDLETPLETNMNSDEDKEMLRDGEVDDALPGGIQQLGLGESEVDSKMNTSPDQVPDDPDEAIAWLERLAAKQGAPAEELPTIESGMQDSDAAHMAGEGPFLSTVDAGEIPEDPDEAMAWLEMLAAKEGGTSELLEPVQIADDAGLEPAAEIETLVDSEPESSLLSADLDEALDSSLPSGLHEALGWLEEMALEPEPTDDTATPVESLPVVEEPPTPAVAHDVDEALAGAEILFAEPVASEDEPAADQFAEELQFEDAEDDAMAWLEQLAARQGAPVEELTTVDSTTDELTLADVAPDIVPLSETEAEDDMAVEISPADSESVIEEQIAQEPEVEIVAISVEDEHAGADLEAQESIPPVETVEETPADTETLLAAMAVEVPDSEQETVEEVNELEELVEQAELPSRDGLEIADEFEAPSEDMAWLETLGAVDAERWLEAEATVAAEEDEFDIALEEASIVEQIDDGETLTAEPVPLFAAAPGEGPESEALHEARRAMEEGEVATSLAKYSELVESGQYLAFLIDDLEVVSEQRGPEPGLQRVLGDAYARNGQLRKALESYREALTNL